MCQPASRRRRRRSRREADYREFVTTVIYHPHLARLPEALGGRGSSTRSPSWPPKQPEPFTLDYWRLNMQATRPLPAA